jgi:hypothetical protein
MHVSGRPSYSTIENAEWKTTSFSVYPNPATDHLFIVQNEPLQLIRCISTDGHQWLITYHQKTNNIYSIDTGNLPRGSYILCVNEKRKLILLE